jgi:DNA topoisomerase I
LLADRRAAGPSPKKAGAKKSAPKKAGAKKAGAKKSTVKKAGVKKAGAKKSTTKKAAAGTRSGATNEASADPEETPF